MMARSFRGGAVSSSRAVGDLLGHKDLATTQIYAKVQQEHLRTIVGKLSGLVPAPEINRASLKRVTQDDHDVGDSPKLLTAVN